MPLRVLLLAALLASQSAHADLYRWIDPASGSVKLSNVPPPWLNDAGRNGRPAVEVISRKEAPAEPSPPAPAARANREAAEKPRPAPLK